MCSRMNTLLGSEKSSCAGMSSPDRFKGALSRLFRHKMRSPNMNFARYVATVAWIKVRILWPAKEGKCLDIGHSAREISSWLEKTKVIDTW